MTAAAPPHSPLAERSVVAHLIANPKQVGEVVGTMLEPVHFHVHGYRLLYERIVDAYYADDPIDALTLGELAAKPLARAWKCNEAHAIKAVVDLSQDPGDGDARQHATIVKREADYRALLELAETVRRTVEAELHDPEAIAAEASTTAMQIATSTLLNQDIISFEELGRRVVRRQRTLMAARAQGIELGAYFGLPFLDNYLRGLKPTEWMVLAGPPGAGKSAVAWRAAQNFAERQLRKAEHERVGALVLSLEMGEEPSGDRVAQAVSGIDGGKLREGKTTDEDLRKIIDEWGSRKEIPLYFNHASIIRSSQLRALVAEAIRRHNVGLVVIDHWRYVKMDGRFASKVEEDEEKAVFFAQRIAKDLNVALISLAHTTKGVDSREDSRPKLSDLRGSGQIAAEADFVSFVYRPFQHASQEDIDEGRVNRTDAELIYEKNRHGLTQAPRFFFDPSTMTVK